MGMRKPLRRGIVVLTCAALGAAVTGRAAAEGPPRPEPPPTAAHGTIRPEAPPRAPAPQSASTSGAATTSVTSSSPSLAFAPPTPSAQTPSVSRTQTRKVVRRAHVAKKDPAPKPPSEPVRLLASWRAGGELLSTSAGGLTKTPSSSESLLLLLVGLALVVLVLGETTLLRMAARAPEPQRTAEEPLPIRRVQLRR